MAVAEKKTNSAPRGRDRKKVDKQWKNVQVVQEYDDGWYLGYLGDPDDLATLGRLMGHCAGTHFIWACEEKIWYFFALFDKDDVPHGTLHAKMTKWMGKTHPRDNAPPIPQQGVSRCIECHGRGRNNLTNVICDGCNGEGYLNNPAEGYVGRIEASAGGYPSFADVKAAFEQAGLKYEPKYAPLCYNSQTYEYGAMANNDRESFEGKYRDPFVGKKPDGISEENWATYTKAFKALRDEFNKNHGLVKINGRTFKFDSKDLIVLSFTDKSHQSGKVEYRKKVAEFLNTHQKAKKEVAA